MRMRGGIGAATLAATLTLLVAIPGGASAGFVSVAESDHPRHPFPPTLYYDSTVNGVEWAQTNNVTVRVSSNGRVATLVDPGVWVLPYPDPDPDTVNDVQQCKYGRDRVSCKPKTRMLWWRVDLRLGDRADAATFAENPYLPEGNADGGDGADVLTGSPTHNSFSGGRGDDRLSGGAGDDSLDDHGTAWSLSSSGADLLAPGPGNDDVDAPTDGDRVLARDGEVDQIKCFGSRARVLADPIDELANCPNAEIG